MIDPVRAARALVLSLWAAFFVYLAASGEVSRYLGPRTYWVVAVGAVALGGAALLHVATLRSDRPARLGGRDALGLLVLVAPLLAVVAVPSPRLGAQAASKKMAAAPGVSPALAPAPAPGGDVSFRDVHYAGASEEYAAALGISDGFRLTLTGFVTHPGGAPQGTFGLTRFYVSCCAADAVPYTVVVAAAGMPEEDTWLRVSGALERRGGHYVLVTRRVAKVAPPDDPYLY